MVHVLYLGRLRQRKKSNYSSKLLQKETLSYYLRIEVAVKKI